MVGRCVWGVERLCADLDTVLWSGAGVEFWDGCRNVCKKLKKRYSVATMQKGGTSLKITCSVQEDAQVRWRSTMSKLETRLGGREQSCLRGQKASRTSLRDAFL